MATTFSISTAGKALFDTSLSRALTLIPVRFETGQQALALDPDFPIPLSEDVSTRLDLEGVIRTRITEYSSVNKVTFGLVFDVPVAYFMGNIVVYFADPDTGAEVPALYMSFPKPIIKSPNVAFTLYGDINYTNVIALFRVDPPSDFRRLAYGSFRNSPFYTGMLAGMTSAYAPLADLPKRMVRQIRNLRGLERILVLRYLRQLGFVTRMGYSLTDTDLNRLATFISLYYPQQQTQHFTDFLGYVLGSRMELVRLWSTMLPNYQYGPFEESPRGATIMDTPSGEWFPTSHVGVTYNHEENPPARLQDLITLFGYLAPIHLVLERIIANVYGSAGVYVVVRGVASVRWDVRKTNLPSDAGDLAAANVATYRLPATVNL